MKAIAINGISKTGKTTVCEAIISGLRRRGFSVGSVKEIHFERFAMDADPEANTRRHRVAGSQLVTARAMFETDVLYQSMLPIDQILRHYDHDYVILEGVTDCNVPRIITAFTEEEILERLDFRAVAVSGVFANTHVGEVAGMPIFHALADPEALVDFVIGRAFEPLPSFGADCCTACGYTCHELAGRIAHKQAERSACLLTNQEVELLINGRPIKMVPFVQKILKNAVLGVAGELEGFAGHAAVEVKFKI